MTTKLGNWIQQQLPEDRLHLLRHQPSYFAKGREVQRLVAWLTDFGFLQQKLEVVGINPLIDDYDLAIPLVSETEQRTLSLIQGALRLSAHILDPGWFHSLREKPLVKIPITFCTWLVSSLTPPGIVREPS